MSAQNTFRSMAFILKVFLLASFGDCLEAFAASSDVLSVMFLGSPMSSPGFQHPQLYHMARSPFQGPCRREAFQVPKRPFVPE